MPGPGGGARGGGGGRGGFSGGSRGGARGGMSGGSRGFSGGSMGGAPRRNPGSSHIGGNRGHVPRGPVGGPYGSRPGGFPGGMPPMGGMGGGFGRPGGYFPPPPPPRPRPRVRRGGCLSSAAALILVPMIILCVLMCSMLSMCSNSYSESSYSYDEETLQDFADSQYAAEFGTGSAYEDNLLLIVLIDENCSDFYYIAWVGDHIVTEINHMLGGNDTILGQAMLRCVNESSYKYSLDSNLAQVMEELTASVQDLKLTTCFTCSEAQDGTRSRMRNYTDLPMTEETVNAALADFNDASGIPTVILVEDLDDVFGNGSASSSSAALLVVLIAIAAIGICLVVIMTRKNKVQNADTDSGQPSYSDFDDAY